MWFIVPVEEILFFIVIPFLVAVVYAHYIHYYDQKGFSVYGGDVCRQTANSACLSDASGLAGCSGVYSRSTASEPIRVYKTLLAIAPLVIGICGYSLFFLIFLKGPTFPWEYFGSEMVIVAGVIFYIAYNKIVTKRTAFVKAFLYLTPFYFFLGFVWDAIGIWRRWWIFPITMKELWPTWVIPISHHTHIMPIEELIFFMVVPWLCICIFDAVHHLSPLTRQCK